MHYDETLGSYAIRINNITFVNDNKQNNEYINNLNKIADNYYKNINNIVKYILFELKKFDKKININIVKERIGKPIIDYDNGIISYLEQSIDSNHIFSLEFLDDNFKALQYFTIND